MVKEGKMPEYEPFGRLTVGKLGELEWARTGGPSQDGETWHIREKLVGDCIDPRAEVQSASGVGWDDPGSDGWPGCLGETACRVSWSGTLWGGNCDGRRTGVRGLGPF